MGCVVVVVVVGVLGWDCGILGWILGEGGVWGICWEIWGCCDGDVDICWVVVGTFFAWFLLGFNLWIGYYWALGVYMNVIFVYE